MVTDPELIKTIMVKDFDTFSEHRPLLPPDVDPIWSNNLLAMGGGQKWQDLRATLSPSFTSSKMKAMFSLMKECSSQFVLYFQSQSDEIVEVELKDSFARLANDVIATTAFGVNCDSLSNPNNEFYKSARALSNVTGIRGLLLLLNAFLPTLAKITRIPIIPKKVNHFFTSIVKDAIKLREEQKIKRPDMLNLLIESRKARPTNDRPATVPEAGFSAVDESDYGKGRQKIFATDEIITSQVLIFFFAGFDSVSTMMSYTIYELALNPDIQEKLRKEVDDTLEAANGEFTYDNLMGMKYLDMVVSESLRKWPPFTDNDRRSVKPYVIKAQRPEEADLYLEKGSILLFPVYPIHRDPKYYPNPEQFDPERFNEENREKINRCAYMPFGSGPRNCIASRFALMEGKLVVAEIIRHFEIVVIRKTQIPIVLSKTNFNPLPDEGIWVGFKRRNLSV
ncbi:hypothetical protein RI129_007586 [Pyrocoelia pectoralis]|uniref:Cytochrome P450 n=1 Tax=Pyrocoelia pectoralis TaxID=417401 RepID=A0AAN7VEQ8_9COLE